MHIERRYTKTSQSPYALIAFETTKSEIRNPDGSVVFSLDQHRGAGRLEPGRRRRARAEIFPQGRRARAPEARRGERRALVPVALGSRRRQRSRRCPRPSAIGSETSAQQVFDRLAGAWAYWGWKGGYFDGEDDARAYFDETRFMLARQMAAPNSPQWFNTGLHWAYGIDGPGQGHYYVDYETGKLTKSKSAYEHPQPHACFIQSVADDLVNEGGIMDLWVREARLFKYGSGTGSNFSAPARREREAFGRRALVRPDVASSRSATARRARSSRAARRAAPPRWWSSTSTIPTSRPSSTGRCKEEQKVAALVAGSKIVKRHLKAILKACVNCEGPGRRLLRHREEPGAEARGQARAPRRRARRHDQARHPVRPPGLSRSRVRHLRHRLGVGGLSDRLRPELQQFGARHRRLPARGRDRRRVEPDAPPRRQDRTRR